MRKFEIIKKFEAQGVTIPSRATAHSAGYDLASIEDITFNPGDIKMVPTGLKVKLPGDEALFVYPRSSLGIKKHLTMSNNVGVIDADYYNNPKNEGHIMVPLYNFGKEIVTIEKGERIAQGIFMNYKKTEDDQSDHIVRLGGFGSSGTK
ncbi:dUTP diphosphatase [Mycoplasmatota bacterium]|nr:dUTP diphosphatase [Mycoplasmatota bacterium]